MSLKQSFTVAQYISTDPGGSKLGWSFSFQCFGYFHFEVQYTEIMALYFVETMQTQLHLNQVAFHSRIHMQSLEWLLRLHFSLIHSLFKKFI